MYSFCGQIGWEPLLLEEEEKSVCLKCLLETNGLKIFYSESEVLVGKIRVTRIDQLHVVWVTELCE